jgi:type IV pilus assembly protein PilM
MPQEKQPLKPDIVSSIFSRQVKKRLSSLFIPKGAKATLGKTVSGKSVSGLPIIKKRFPFGLDIGTNSIKVIQLACDQAGEIKLINLAIEELPKEAQAPLEIPLYQQGKQKFLTGQGHNLEARQRILPEILKKLVNEKGLKGDCFAIAPYPSFKVELIRLPQMPASEIDKALRWEIRQTVQADLNELSLDYIVLEGQKAKFLGLQIGVLAVYAPKKDIFEQMALLESAGFNPQALDIEPLADLAVLNYTKKAAADEVILFLDFGAGKTSLSIICDNELISTRPLNVTGNSLTKAISEYCNISWEEAELLKKTFGLVASSTEQTITGSSDKAMQARNVILPLLENMVQDIEHTFKYFSYQVTQSQITRFDKIILSGGSSLLKGLTPFLRNRLNVDVQIIDSLVNFGSLEPSFKGDDLSCRLNVALGLALRGIE